MGNVNKKPTPNIEKEDDIIRRLEAFVKGPQYETLLRIVEGGDCRRIALLSTDRLPKLQLGRLGSDVGLPQSLVVLLRSSDNRLYLADPDIPENSKSECRGIKLISELIVKCVSYAGLVLGLDFDLPRIQSGREFEMKLSTIGYARDLVEANSGSSGGTIIIPKTQQYGTDTIISPTKEEDKDYRVEISSLQLVIDDLKNSVLNKLQSIFRIGNNNLIISDTLSLQQLKETLVSITKDAGDASRKLNLILGRVENLTERSDNQEGAFGSDAQYSYSDYEPQYSNNSRSNIYMGRGGRTRRRKSNRASKGRIRSRQKGGVGVRDVFSGLQNWFSGLGDGFNRSLGGVGHSSEEMAMPEVGLPAYQGSDKMVVPQEDQQDPGLERTEMEQGNESVMGGMDGLGIDREGDQGDGLGVGDTGIGMAQRGMGTDMYLQRQDDEAGAGEYGPAEDMLGGKRRRKKGKTRKRRRRKIGGRKSRVRRKTR